MNKIKVKLGKFHAFSARKLHCEVVLWNGWTHSESREMDFLFLAHGPKGSGYHVGRTYLGTDLDWIIDNYHTVVVD